jgi:hypothetical protein
MTTRKGETIVGEAITFGRETHRFYNCVLIECSLSLEPGHDVRFFGSVLERCTLTPAIVPPGFGAWSGVFFDSLVNCDEAAASFMRTPAT